MLPFLIFLNLFIISGSTEERILKIQEIEYLVDENFEYSFDDIQEGKGLFTLNPRFKPTDFQHNTPYWIRLTINIPDNGKDYLLEVFDQTIDSLSIYVRSDKEDRFTSYTAGDMYHFDDKFFNHKNFEVPLGKAGKYQCYIRIVSHQYVDIRFSVRSFDFFIEYSLAEYFLYGIFYGMIVIISVYNLLIFVAIREIKYLYYTFYILSVGLYAMCIDGIAYQYFWPNSPSWNQMAYGVALFLVIFWSIIFSKRFLRLHIRSPKLNSLLNIVFGFRVAIFFYALIIDQSVFQLRNIELVPLTIIFIGGISVYLRGYKPARFFIVAYGFLFLGFMVKALMMIFAIPVFPLSYYSLHFAFVLEMLFLSYALSDRVRILKANRDRALKRIIDQHEKNSRFKDKVNARLEKTVNDRTIELKEKNELLTKQTKEISEINSILDLDNWRLRNNIRSIQRERLLNVEMTFEEFKQVFTDKSKCLQALSSYKWEKGYQCLKCKNRNYGVSNLPYGRRCSRCGYNESATTNTLFHALKFPIEKAFYILHVTLNNTPHTLAELSSELGIRRNTVLDFKHRISELSREDHLRLRELFHKLDAEIQNS